MNPLIPSPGDVLWASAAILNAVLMIAALISLARAADKRRWLPTLLLIVFVPFAGPVTALVMTQASARRATGHSNPKSVPAS